MSVVYVIADTPRHQRVIQDGHLPTAMSCFRLEFDGDQDEAVGRLAGSFPPDTRFGVVNDRAVRPYRLAPRLEKHDVKPGEPVDG